MRSLSGLNTNKTAALVSLSIPSQVRSVYAARNTPSLVVHSGHRPIHRLPLPRLQRRDQQQRYLGGMSSAAATSGGDTVIVEAETTENLGREDSRERQEDGAKSSEAEAEPALPALSAHEFKQYNRLAEHMDYFVRSP